jgi:O-antigen ligase
MWYYGIIAVFVVVMLVSDPRRVNSWLRLFGRIIPWMLVWFPFAIILDAAFIEQFPKVPDSRISIVSHRTGNIAVMAAVALGFLWLVDRDSTIFNRRQRTTLTVLATFVLLFAALRNRGGFVAGGAALLIAFVFLRGQRANMAGIIIGVAIVLLTVGLFGNIRVQLFDGREVSIDQFVDNVASVMDPSTGGQRQESTTRWRLAIWGQVLEDVTQDRPITGFGPGPDVGKLYNVSGDGELPLRNPHNSHVGVLARMGTVGVALWALLWITWFVELVSLRRRLTGRGRSGEAAVAGWLIVSVVAILVNAVFDPTLEGPQVGWWLWAFLGFGIAMSVLDRWNRLPALDLGGKVPADRPAMVATP